VEHFGFVSLAGVEKLAASLGVVLLDGGEVAPRVEKLLGGENAEEGGFHRSFHADLLFLSFDLSELRFLGKNVSATSEFSGGDHGLLDKETLFATGKRTAPDFIAGVADRWIRVEAGLLLARLGGANFGFGLAERGIRFGGKFLSLVESEKG